jgi:outer membrane protein TolC
MSLRINSLRSAPWLCAIAAAMLAGCATSAIDDNYAAVQQDARDRLGVEPRWLTSDDARRQAQADVDAALAKPLSAYDAVRIALSYSPALQAALYEGAAHSAVATQSARLPNPVFTFQRLARDGAGGREVEIDRLLSFSLLDVLLAPARMRMADFQQRQTRLRLAGDVVQTAAEARQAWVRAVAAQQSLGYQQQVKAAADASAELARRMQAAGNFSKLQQAREQAFSVEAIVQLTRARQAAQATREALVRSLGLDDTRAARLQLPERLPDLPPAAKDERSVSQAGLDQRIDIALARARLEFVAQEQGLTRVTGVVNGLQLGAARNSETGKAPQRGFELEVPLPVFDFGDASRARAQATYMAALQRTAALAVDARSQLRESYGAYRSAYELARHYRDEIVPLRKTISDENLLRYNGMLIGVFELLADAREQIGSVVQSIDAQRDFWLADAALQATLIGQPTSSMSTLSMETQP